MSKNKLEEFEKSINHGKIGRVIALCCCAASIINMFVKNDIIQNIIWCALGVALLCVILDDSKQIQRIMGYYQDALRHNMILVSLPDEISARLEEAEFCDEDLKEQFNAIVWEPYFEVWRKSDES